MIEIAVKAAIEAGEAILEIYAQDFEVEYKADESPLTSADKAAHNIIVKALETTPYPVLSEESAEIGYSERKGWTTYWLVDPLDGTKEFIKKNGEFTVNIALIKDGVPLMGVVYVPVEETIYCGQSDVECGMSAWKSMECVGKTYNELLKSAVALSTSNYSLSTKQRTLRVVASKSHCNDETRQFIAELEEKFGSAELVSRGSSLKLCMVAEGSADIYPRIAPTMEWDTAAAHAVVTAAGGRVFSYASDVAASSYTAVNSDLKDLPYNKENLLNTYFVVSGLHE
ncbi:3'(2'),5'-bisphosphate nucleotidase CysQ [Pontiella sulfatireligans]|uniref:3'(2'),5'-bisphosphate nucleotidase CysQ n=1 Tax=Pontiella sulfatireligans TaxID=2750658 RepID=A0A6C2UG97_9BACT|nr:3'(2'),5'-bisphosphate nucleotidase CysQ [Pontiella sulfatireligans]VGO18236.1 3'(2'),5'-bisphosphate nucleotidase CysQ [Pontiella sulfatireligans]